ncbi:uncharacterized protein F4817DRAFT_241819 [Daldinia loculata]|uniref:uncharacterized protein n=1 Tax=Daldinia loculata TaxID=103429 RepID=UPI0020C4AB61|nr:uncharacterized protein F4817DRAFT_241819 [Daldinia loculata]KAI1650780.1 hypothetical protein F4817DRAFT_241819 [Daldinia loculata]
MTDCRALLVMSLMVGFGGRWKTDEWMIYRARMVYDRRWISRYILSVFRLRRRRSSYSAFNNKFCDQTVIPYSHQFLIVR